MPSFFRPLTAALVLAALALLAVGCGGSEPREDQDDRSAEAPRTAHVREGRGAPMPPPPGGEAGMLSPLDVDDPELANLDPDLLAAVQAAFDDAAADGIRFWVTSGWRSREEQQRLLDAAVAEHGSLEEALRYVSTPDTSAHVTGDAVDIGPTEADSWLSQHGADYGLCQSFANEIWHFELATTRGDECPRSLPDSSYR